MSKLVWDSTGSRFYETGISKAVFFDSTGAAVPWNGLTSVTETNTETNETVNFIDGYRYMNKISSNSYSGTITAFTYPSEFAEYIGYLEFGETYQKPKYFNLSYQTTKGNDVNGNDLGYKIHFVYNALAVQTTNEFISYGSSVTPTEFSWDIDTLPINIPNLKPSSHVIIDSTKSNPETITAIEEILYGNETTDARIPDINELISIFDATATFKIIDHGDGSFTAVGDDEHVRVVTATEFELISDSVYQISDDTFSASSR
jgi:hypothetical protein